MFYLTWLMETQCACTSASPGSRTCPGSASEVLSKVRGSKQKETILFITNYIIWLAESHWRHTGLTFHPSLHPTEPLLGHWPVRHFDGCRQNSRFGDGAPHTGMTASAWNHLWRTGADYIYVYISPNISVCACRCLLGSSPRFRSGWLSAVWRRCEVLQRRGGRSHCGSLGGPYRREAAGSPWCDEITDENTLAEVTTRKTWKSGKVGGSLLHWAGPVAQQRQQLRQQGLKTHSPAERKWIFTTVKTVLSVSQRNGNSQDWWGGRRMKKAKLKLHYNMPIPHGIALACDST